jgi:16S rRNA (uracil1498-N3)-methyltransferase
MRVLIGPVAGWAPGQRVTLDESESHHLRVRRAQDGDKVEILDGAGLRGTGHLVHTAKVWSVEVAEAVREAPPAELTLAVAAGDRDRFSWMAEKAVELGVSRIIPLETTRSSAVATGLRVSHLSRLRRQALEATKQCGAAWAVVVDEPVALDDFLRQPLRGVGWLADQSGAAPPTEIDGRALTIVIGPEGGLDQAERAQVLSAGYLPIVLGPYTLRFETASLAAAALATTARMRGSRD